MIRINLLPVREIQRRNKAKREIVCSGGAFFSLLLLFVFIAIYQFSVASGLQEESKRIQAEKQKYEKIIAEIKQLEEKKKVLQTRIEVIKQLKRSSSLTVHILDEVANNTPPYRMWLTKLQQNAGDLKLSGMALDDQTVAKYMDDLASSPYIQNVTLANASMEKFAERDLKSFSLSCAVAVPANKNDKK